MKVVDDCTPISCSCERIWLLGEAIDLVKLIQATSMTQGYYLAIAGGVLNKGYSNNDLDLVAVPRTPNEKKELFKTFIYTQFDIRASSGGTLF